MEVSLHKDKQITEMEGKNVILFINLIAPRIFNVYRISRPKMKQ